MGSGSLFLTHARLRAETLSPVLDLRHGLGFGVGRLAELIVISSRQSSNFKKSLLKFRESRDFVTLSISRRPYNRSFFIIRPNPMAMASAVPKRFRILGEVRRRTDA